MLGYFLGNLIPIRSLDVLSLQKKRIQIAKIGGFYRGGPVWTGLHYIISTFEMLLKVFQ